MKYEHFEAQTKALLIQRRVDQLLERSFERQRLLARLKDLRTLAMKS